MNGIPADPPARENHPRHLLIGSAGCAASRSRENRTSALAMAQYIAGSGENTVPRRRPACRRAASASPCCRPWGPAAPATAPHMPTSRTAPARMSLRIIASSRFMSWCGRRRSIRPTAVRDTAILRGNGQSVMRGPRPAFPGFRPAAVRATIVGKNKQKLSRRETTMINRRTFAALLAGTVAAPKRAWSEPVTAKTVFYTSVGR